MKYERSLPDGALLASYGEHLNTIDQSKANDLVVSHLEGAGYWNLRKHTETGEIVDEEEQKKWKGIVNHVLLEYNLSIVLARKLKEVGEKNDIDELKEINLTDVANGSLISDIAKGRSDKERLKPENPDIDTHSPLGYQMGLDIGLPEHVARVALTHHFPTEENQIPTWLDKIVFLADIFTSQRYMTVEERMNDIENRWITQRQANGQEPLIDPEHFAKYRDLGFVIRDKVFQLLSVSDEQEFLASIPHIREEQYLRALYEKHEEERGIIFAKKLSATK